MITWKEITLYDWVGVEGGGGGASTNTLKLMNKL